MKIRGIEFTPILIKNEKTNYGVSKSGDIINFKTNKLLKWKIDSKGYPTVTLSVNGTPIDQRVHRLVAFNYVENPNQDKYNVVNHLDGNKMNPNYTNLEWTDSKGNSQHAIDHGLARFLYGEDRPNAILTNDQVRSICILMEDGETTQREIARMYNVPEYIIHEIRLGHNWKEISKNYKIENCKIGIVPESSDKVKRVCEEIEKNELTLTEISKKCDVSYDKILRILNLEIFRNISKDYDFTKYDKKTRYPSTTLDEVRRLLIDGFKPKYIIDTLELPNTGASRQMIHRMKKRIFIK